MRYCTPRGLVVAALLSLFQPLSAAEIYLSPSGNDENPGTQTRPFATIERARDEIRRIKAAGMPAGGISVILTGGEYQLSRPVELSAEDSGTQDAPIEYRAKQGDTVKIVGGREVTGWKPVTDPAILKRLDKSARGHVWQANLKSLGITDLEGINSAQTYRSDPGLEVFFQRQADDAGPLPEFRIHAHRRSTQHQGEDETERPAFLRRPVRLRRRSPRALDRREGRMVTRFLASGLVRPSRAIGER